MMELDSASQLLKLPLNFLREAKIAPDMSDSEAETYLGELARIILNFVRDPAHSTVTLGWITMWMDFYSKVAAFEVAEAFFQRIDLAHIARMLPPGHLSHVVSFTDAVIHYVGRIDSLYDRTVLISTVFEAIDLQTHATFVNSSVRERLTMVSQPGYTSESEVTWASVLKTIANNYNRAANLVSDSSVKGSVKAHLADFYCRIDFCALGQLMEVQGKGLGPVVRVLDMLRKISKDQSFKKSAQFAFLSGLDFKRLALSYNEQPIGRSSVANFCTRYTLSKSLSDRWQMFFETLDLELLGGTFASFSKQEYDELLQANPNAVKHLGARKATSGNVLVCVRDLSDSQRTGLGQEAVEEIVKRAGFNYLHTARMLQVLGNVFCKDPATFSRILDSFSFEQIGLILRGKSASDVDQLLRRLSSVDLPSGRYLELVNALGMKECRRLLDEHSRYIRILLKYKCNLSERDLEAIGLSRL